MMPVLSAPHAWERTHKYPMYEEKATGISAKGITIASRNQAQVISPFDGNVIFTRDTHHDNYMSTQEGTKLPVIHCIENTSGWQLCDELLPFAET